MSPILTGVLGALAPVFLLILLGALLRRADWPATGFWPGVDRLVFWVLFPPLLAVSLARAELTGVALLPFIAATAGPVLLVAAGCLLLQRQWPARAATFAATFQGCIRPNTYIALAVAATAFGGPALALTAVAIAVVIPLVNVLSVAVLSQGDGSLLRDPAVWQRAAAGVVRNPIIIGCAVGILLNLIDLGLPPVLGPMAEILGRSALALALLGVGAGLQGHAVRSDATPIALSATAKLVLLPALTALACGLLGVGGLAAQVAVLFAAMPASASSYVMTRELGGNAALMAGIVAVHTVLAAVSLSIWLGLLQ
jgi:predicted permease